MNHPKRTSHAKQQQQARSSGLILEIITDKADRGSLNEILHRAGWQAAMCRRLTTAEPLLPMASVVMCDEELPDGNWRDVLTHLEGMPMNPALIVTSHRADEHLWVEVLNLGAYDLLLEPFRTEEVVRTIENCGRFPLKRSEPGEYVVNSSGVNLPIVNYGEKRDAFSERDSRTNRFFAAG